jgi:hypothetical protein
MIPQKKLHIIPIYVPPRRVHQTRSSEQLPHNAHISFDADCNEHNANRNGAQSFPDNLGILVALTLKGLVCEIC